MVVNGRPLKRANRRVTADLYDFLTFPADGDGMPRDLDGPFRSNVRAFLARHARLPMPQSILSPPLASNLMTWRVAFRIGEAAAAAAAVGEEGAAAVELDVVEEDVPRSRSVYCDHCRVVGWSGHPVCGKRYHFIIRNDCNLASSNHRACPRCGTMMHLLDVRCISCNNELTSDDIEDWEYLQLENSTHLLHGVVHTNGYGHLLRVNGRQGGSKFLSGSDIMDFWDRLCKMLHVRKVTVMDISKKYEIEYRLLHAVTTGHPWYGNWGYEFGAGSFCATTEDYHKAVQTLSNVKLSIFFTHSRSPRTQLQDTIALYWSLTDRPLVTLRDLFSYILDLLHDQTMHGTFATGKEKLAVPAGVLCVWTKEDIERAEHAIIKVLQAVDGSQWVSWRALKGATCPSVTSPELLDYCLKGLGGKCVDGSMVVAVRCSTSTSAIEYRLEAAVSDKSSPMSGFQCRPSAQHLVDDLKFLYSNLLNPATMQPYKPLAFREATVSSARKLLDCKQFVKHYDQTTTNGAPLNPFALRIWCHAELTTQPNDRTTQPPELVILPLDATVADLKFQASKAFRETYVMFQRFQAEQVFDYRHVSDSTNVKLLLGLNGVIRVRGSCSGDERRLWNFRMERGTDNWTVDCACGAKDDDGERMMACDVCEVWRHTRCSEIEDHEEAPAKFVCDICKRVASDNKPRSRVAGRYKGGSSSSSSGRCKDDVGAGRYKGGSSSSSGRCKDDIGAGRYRGSSSSSSLRCKDDIGSSSSPSSITEAGRYEHYLATIVQ